MLLIPSDLRPIPPSLRLSIVVPQQPCGRRSIETGATSALLGIRERIQLNMGDLIIT